MKRLLPIALIVSLVGSWLMLPVQPARASITACSATLTPHQVDGGSSRTYQFTLTNNDPDTIQWIRISRPSADFTLTSASASGWTASLSADNATFRNGGLDQNDTLTLNVNATVGSINQTLNWTLYVSDSPTGSGQFACDGDLSVTVGSVVQPVISNVAASAITTSSATITWTTNIAANSKVSYGLTSGYGNNNGPTGSFVTSHSLQLTGLAAGTLYHYKVTSATSQGGTAASGNNTFTTAAAPSAPGSAAPTVQAPAAAGAERTPPTISFSSNFAGVYKQPPTFSGRASDNVGVAAVEYSVDGGATWLPVDQLQPAPRTRRATRPESAFSFTPINMEDGDYAVMARAIDAAGNQATTEQVRVVIDKLPPLVGGAMLAVGPQVITAQPEGTLESVVGVGQTITFSAVGGPIAITIEASVKDNPALTRSFSLQQSKATALWSGILKFDYPGAYSLQAKAVDGAGNNTTRSLGQIQVAPAATVVEKGSNKPLEGATAVLHYFVPQTGTWAVWDGEAYGQPNPQGTNSQGRFQFYPPAGKYYLELKKSGMRTVYSQIFVLDEPTPITSAIEMRPSFGIGLGSQKLALPMWSSIRLEPVKRGSLTPKSHPLVEQRLPAFSLTQTGGQKISNTDLVGKPTLISFISTWSPPSKDQLPVLANLQKHQRFNIVPINILESPEKVAAYLALSGYGANVAIDRDGQTIGPFAVTGLPAHVVVDRQGFVKKLMVGVLSEEEISTKLGEL